MARVEILAILVGLGLAVGFVLMRIGSTGAEQLDGAAAVFAMVAAWWGIAIGIWNQPISE
jgi:hypothetical protein